MTPTTRLFLLRHGEVEERYHGIFGGRIDMNLSPRGHEQAHALAHYLRAHRFDAIYVSPMKRAQQTLAPMTHLGARPPVTRDALREVDFGVWTGLAWQDVWQKHEINPADWLGQLERGEISEGESGPALRERIGPCVREILAAHEGQSIAVVCHGGVIRVILGLLLNLPLAPLGGVEIEYASVTRVDVHPHRTGLHLLNFTPWRDLA